MAVKHVTDASHATWHVVEVKLIACCTRSGDIYKVLITAATMALMSFLLLANNH